VRNVLLVSATAKRGGAERSLAALAQRLPQAGWEPQVALLEAGPLEGWLGDTAIHRLGDRRDARTALAGLARDSDVVVSNKWRSHLLAGPAAADAGRPCVWWQQDFPDASPAELLDGSVPAAVAVCSSDAVLGEQRAAAPWLAAVKVPLGIDVDAVVARRGSGTRVRAALDAGDAPLIGIAGRLAPDKRQDLFLRAAARVAQEQPDARFVVIGGEILGTHGEYAAGLPALAHGLGIGDRVVFAGHQADAYAWIDALDVLVHAAEREPFGLVLVEALALSRRTVAIDTAGPGEILAGGHGLLVAPRDADALAGAILRALADPSLAARGGARAHAFTDTRMADAFADVLDRATQ
jgi:glycosyltransferase involved in cell wall biosynthesis